MSRSVVLFPVSHGVSGVETLALKKARWYVTHGYEVFVYTPFRNELHDQFTRVGARIGYSYFPSGRVLVGADYVGRFVAKAEAFICRHSTLEDIAFIEAFNPIGALIAETASHAWSRPAVTGVVSTFGYNPHVLAGRDWRDLVVAFAHRDALHVMNEPCLRGVQASYSLSLEGVPTFPLPLQPQASVYQPRDDGFKILSVGRLDPIKQYNLYMLDIVAALRPEFPGLSYTIIGSGSLEPQIRHKVGHLGLAESFSHIESWANERFAELASSYDVFVGTGYSALELAVLGLPALLGPTSEPPGLTPGYVDEAEGYTVGEDIGRRPKRLEDCLRDFLRLSAVERQAVSDRVRTATVDTFGEDRIMPGFVDFALAARVASSRSHYVPSEMARPPTIADRLASGFRNHLFPMWSAYRRARSSWRH